MISEEKSTSAQTLDESGSQPQGKPGTRDGMSDKAELNGVGVSVAPAGIAPYPPKGGPRTLEGKARSRTNALRHGLTATTLCDAVLPANRVNELRAELCAEIGPRTVIERLLVDEVARHAAMLELGERAELAVLRHGAAGLAAFGVDASQSEDPDAVLAAAVASDAVDKFSRYRRGHEKAAYAAIKALRELRIAGGTSPGAPNAVSRSPLKLSWQTEANCEAWLAERAAGGAWQCPLCGHSRANWLRARKALQCQRCRRQSGLRAGTVAARSRLPLTVWFAAMVIVLEEPTIAAAELARRTGIRRPATAQTMLNRIRAALAADDADRRLAGLLAAMRV